MSELYIRGGKKLNFKNINFDIPAYKHAFVPILCSTVLFPEIEFHFPNIPKIADACILVEILQLLDAECIFEPPQLQISTRNLKNISIPTELSREIHGALYLFPALLGRFGFAKIGQCGGCSIGEKNILGARPYEHMTEVLQFFGCEVSLDSEFLIGSNRPHKPVVIDIKKFSDYPGLLSGPRVSGATKIAIMAALALKKDKVHIQNPYTKPDVLELLRFAKYLGYRIQFESNCISIGAPPSHFEKSIKFSIIGDISVLMTYITLAVAHKKKIEIIHQDMQQMLKGLASEISFLKKMGIKIIVEQHRLRVDGDVALNPIDIEVLSTSIFSDHQPFFALMLSEANGISTIHEKVWKDRFSYVDELNKLGFNLKIDAATVIIKEKSWKFDDNVEIQAKDLRSAATLLIASSAYPNKINFYGHEHLDRGYEDFIGLLKKIGVDICETNAG